MDDSTFAYYAIAKPRPYTLVVFMTAAAKKYKCTICKQLDVEVTVLAKSYAAEMKASKGKPEVFFIRLDYESSPRVFQSYQMQSVPVVFHIGPNQGEAVEKDYYISPYDKYQLPSDTTAEMLSKFLRERSAISINIEHSMIMTYVILLGIFVLLAALVRPVIEYLPFFLSLLRLKPLWITVSAGIYTCAISGLIFDIIRSPPM